MFDAADLSLLIEMAAGDLSGIHSFDVAALSLLLEIAEADLETSASFDAAELQSSIVLSANDIAIGDVMLNAQDIQALIYIADVSWSIEVLMIVIRRALAWEDDRRALAWIKNSHSVTWAEDKRNLDFKAN